MARNKYPEETVNKILQVAHKLFMEKGYENTSIQDIIDHLGGLSKGAIYHHFKSKNDILIAIVERTYSGIEVRMMAIASRKDLNGLGKLREIFRESLDNPRQNEVFSIAANYADNPQMLSLELREIADDTAPRVIQPIIEEGVRDGSIQTEYPQQLAEMILLLSNLWINPMAFGGSMDVILGRAKLLRELLDAIGLPVIDDHIMQRFEELCGYFTQHQKL